MEKDPEVKGEGNSYTTEFRQYDNRLGRWLSLDPKASSGESPYASMGNNPIIYTDVLGDTIRIVHDTKAIAGKGYFTQTFNVRTDYTVDYYNGKLYDIKGDEFVPEPGSFADKVLQDLNQLSECDPILAFRIDDLIASKNVHIIKATERLTNYDKGIVGSGNKNAPGPAPLEADGDAVEQISKIKEPNTKAINQAKNDDKNGIPTGSHTFYDPYRLEDDRGKPRAPRTALAHELLGHGWDTDQGLSDHTVYGKKGDFILRIFEFSATQIENIARNCSGDKFRDNYSGFKLPIEFGGRNVKNPPIEMKTIPTEDIINKGSNN